MSNKTLPLTVRNTGFLLDRLGSDCHPLQFLRELTQNSIEAIKRTEDSTAEIVWDVDWLSHELGDGDTYKLCVMDNGDGMTPEEMIKYINHLSSSLSDQSFEGNYGVGAKIAAATRNPAGLIYMSWKNGEGSMIHLWRDKSEQYGLKQIERPDGTFGHWGELDDDVKPEIIQDHGTVVILLGNKESDDTMKGPKGVSSPSKWIAKYLNSRYFDLPEGITIKAREGWKHTRTDKGKNFLRSIIGQKNYLEDHSIDSGVEQLSEANAYWWILKDESANGNNSGFIESSGHVAALHQSELYELVNSRAGRVRLQNFGILFGHNRVVIYIEPKPINKRLSTNTARTQLLIESEALPWADYAAEFRNQMPGAIKELMDEVSSKSQVSDHSKNIRERLKSILDLYKVSRYQPADNGNLRIEDPRSGGAVDGEKKGDGDSESSGTSGKAVTSTGEVYSVFLKNKGRKGKQSSPDIFPTVQWVSVENSTRVPGDIEDRAARFLIDQNILQINADFRVFNDMTDSWFHEFGSGIGGIRGIIEDAVHAWFEQALVETVIGIQALKDSKEWSIDEITSALSEEALTSAVMQRYHVNIAVKRELGTKLGSLSSAG